MSDHTLAFVVIDALDEFEAQDRNSRSRFIDELLNLWSNFGANILVTSRFIPEITSRFDNGVIGKEVRARNEDITRYMDGQLPTLPGFNARDEVFWAEIKQKIMDCVDGM